MSLDVCFFHKALLGALIVILGMSQISSDRVQPEIEILNPQSYPVVGGNWTVAFITKGRTDLIISPVGTTLSSHADSGYDLRFVEIRCGNLMLNYTWLNGTDSILVRDYACSKTGYATFRVLTSQMHKLEFRFGEDIEYARNFAVYTCSSCEECSSYLQNGTMISGDILKLTADITNAADTCISFGGADNITFDCNGHTISGDGDPYDYGIWLNDSDSGSNNNTIKNCGNISYFRYGIYLDSSDNNTLTNITLYDNYYDGIRLSYSDQNTLTNITSNYNNKYGIYLFRSSFNTLQNITLQENDYYDFYISASSDSECNNFLQNITGSGGRPIEYYNYSVNLQDKTLSELILCNADNSNLTNITILGSPTKKNNMLYLLRTENTTLSQINSSYNYRGICLDSSSSNILTNITVNYNDRGIYICQSNNNSLTNITANYNYDEGILLYGDSDYNNITSSIITNNAEGIGLKAASGDVNWDPEYNCIYNNFFNNTQNIEIGDHIDNPNFFNTSLNCSGQTNIIGGPCIGGNYWTDPDGNFSDTCQDQDGNGICDSEYNISADYSWAKDYLPLSPTPIHIELHSPEDNAEINTTKPSFTFTVYDIYSTTFSCTLWINRTDTGSGTPQPYDENTSVLNNTLTTLTANSSLLKGSYDWWISCANAYAKQNQSEIRRIILPTHLILFWDNETVDAPEGWTCISCSPGDPFYERFPRGNEKYGATGGSETHTHAVIYVNETACVDTLSAREGTESHPSSANHTHGGISSYSVSNATSLPSYRSLKVIVYDSGIPTTIPAGAIAIFNESIPPGWSLYTAQDGYFVMGNASISTGGNNTHYHSTVKITLSIAKGTVGTEAYSTDAAISDHTHTGSGGPTSTADHRPPFINVTLAKAESDTEIPIGLIGMFDGTPPSNWIVKSGPGGDFYKRFIVGSTAYGATGGSENHTHDNLVISVSWASDSWDRGRSIGQQVSVADEYHNHNVTVSFSNESNLPPYIDVIFAYLSDASPPVAEFGTNPPDNYISSSSTITFELKCWDDVQPDYLQLWSDWSGVWSANQTNSSPINNTVWYVTVSGIPEGEWKWGVYCNDTSGNEDWSDTNRTLIIDSTSPSVNLEYPPNNTINTTTRVPKFIFNTSDDRASTLSCEIFLNRTDTGTGIPKPYGTVNALNDSSTTIQVNETLADGDYEWWITCSDGANEKESEKRSLSIRFPSPSYANFDDPETTDFESVEDITNVCQPLLGKVGVFRIVWYGCVNASWADFDTYITFGYNFVDVDSANLNDTFNTSANITFYGLSYLHTPVILRDGKICNPPDCVITSYSSGTLSFNVTHFTNYSSSANSNLSIWDQTDPEGGSRTVYVNENVTFFANYTNLTSGEPINGSGVYCEISFNVSPYGPFNMTFNSSSLLYEYNRSFSLGGFYSWNVTCNGSVQDYEPLSANDSITIKQGYLEVMLVEPVDQKNVAQNTTFLVNVTVYCRKGYCGNVTGRIRYNSTSSNPDTDISTTEGDTPFYITDNPNPQNCSGNPLDKDEYCELVWNVNATGTIGSSYKIGALLESNMSYLDDNTTDNNTIQIVSCILDITLQWDSIDFGNLQPGTTNNSAPGNVNDNYNITVESVTTCNVDLYIKGTDLNRSLNDNYYIQVGNITWNNATNEYSSGYRLGYSWNLLKEAVSPSTNVTMYYWIDIPFGITADNYTGTLYIEGVESGEEP